DGTELKHYSGSHPDFWTDWFAVGQVTVRLDSDDTLNDWGYLIDSVASDAGAGGPVAGATITLSPGGASVMTAADGGYQLLGVVPGSYSLTASAPGFLLTPSTLPATVPAWGLGGEDFDATLTAPAAPPGVVAALSPSGSAEVESFSTGSWTPLPDPSAGQLQRPLALQGLNDIPELIAVSEGHLLHNRLNGGAWTGWRELEGPVTDRAPVAAAELDGTLDVLTVGPDGTVLHYR